MSKKPRENRVPIMMSDEELTRIDDWRFENRVNTRSEAIRRLCVQGLMVEQFQRTMVLGVALVVERFEKEWEKKDIDNFVHSLRQTASVSGELKPLLDKILAAYPKKEDEDK